MLDNYSKTKKNIIAGLAELQQIADSGRVKAAARAIRNKLAADVFLLVVVGQFKRGKTTFINALLGRDLLPTAIIPLTSIITILNYGEELKIVAFFRNGAQREIRLDDLSLCITEKHNPKNEKNIERVEIFYPSDYLKNGVKIIDTPGIGSTHEHNTRTTYDYLPRADAAIFLVSADPPLTQPELQFLRDLKNLVAKIFFVQNKADMVSPADRQESLDFSRQVIEQEAEFDNIEIFPLSAKEALEGKTENNTAKLEQSGLVRFEKLLGQFLMEEKGSLLLDSAVMKADNLIDEELLLAELTEKSIRLPLQDLENKTKKFEIFIRDINQEKIDSGRLLADEIDGLQKETLARDLETLKQEKTQWLTAEIAKFAAAHRSDDNQRFAELMNEFLDAQLRNIFDQWRAQEEMVLKNRLTAISQRFANRLNKILDQIIQTTTEMFDIPARHFRLEPMLPPEMDFRFQITDDPEMLNLTLKLARRALPRALAQKLIIKEAKEKATMLIDRHCGKAKYDFSERLEKMVKNYCLEIAMLVEQAQNDVLRALAAGLAAKQKTAAEISIAQANLKKRIKGLKEIKNLWPKKTSQ